MIVGVLVTGENAVRAAHSLAAHPGVGEVVVVGPANSRNYRVITDVEECDLLLGSGPEAPARARSLGRPLVWDGPGSEEGVGVWGASPVGLALALAMRETAPGLVAVAHPGLEEGRDDRAVFPRPVGKVAVSEIVVAGRTVTAGRPGGSYGAVVVGSPQRSVTVVDDAKFMAGVTLAAGAMVLDGTARPVWDEALPYLEAAIAMGLVMASDETR